MSGGCREVCPQEVRGSENMFFSLSTTAKGTTYGCLAKMNVYTEKCTYFAVQRLATPYGHNS